MAKRAGLYQSLLVRLNARESELAQLQEQLQASQGMLLNRHKSYAVPVDIGS